MSEELTVILKDISSQLSRLIKIIEFQTKSPVGFEWQDLMKLPKHLQTTAIVLGKTGCVCAVDVAQATGRARAVESSYLNDLVLLGLAKKEKRSNKTVYYFPVIE